MCVCVCVCVCVVNIKYPAISVKVLSQFIPTTEINLHVKLNIVCG